jgi:O-antigen/teichoic acid export membrane protein
VINLLLNRTDILLIGAVLGTTQVGPYAAASRTAVVIQFGLNAVALVAAPLIAGFHAQRRTRELQRVITLSGYGILAYTVVVTAGLIVAGRWLLSLFGQGFPDAYPILIVLAVGNIGNALTGPASLVMSMTGAQRRLTVIMSIFLGVNVVFTLLLLPAFGPLGAALVTAAAGIGWNVTATLVVRRRFGLNCFAIQRLEPEGADGAAR